MKSALAQLTSLLRANAKASSDDFSAIGQFVHLKKNYSVTTRKRDAAAVSFTMRWIKVSSSKNVSGIPMITGALSGTMLPTYVKSNE